MDNQKKTIKQQRVEGYFIDAAKEIIINEGAQHVTVRRIADLSGYSYGSIYNYYTDLDELMFAVKNAMIYDMMNTMQSDSEAVIDSIDGIKAINRMFLDYFIENPNVYEFFYTFQIKKSGHTPMDDINFNENNIRVYRPFVEAGIIEQEDLKTVFNTILYSLYGLLTLYFSSNGLSKDDAYKNLDEIIDFVLKKR